VVVLELLKGERPEVVEKAAGMVGRLAEIEREDGHPDFLPARIDQVMLRQGRLRKQAGIFCMFDRIGGAGVGTEEVRLHVQLNRYEELESGK
jgi:hypothetical protein